MNQYIINMNKFNEYIDGLLEQDVGTQGIQPTQPQTSNIMTPENIEIQSKLQAFDELREFFNSREFIKVYNDKNLTDEEKWKRLSNLLRKHKSDPNKSNLENAINDVSRQWKSGTKLKRLQMVGRGIKKAAKGIGGLVLPTAGGSTGVFS